MDSHHFVVMLSYFSFFLLNYASTVNPYTLKPSDSIMDGQTLNSQAGIFQLGFFTPSANSKKRYLGIWYKSLPTQTVVWVANRDAPIHDNSGVFKLDSSTGNLMIVANLTQDVIWSSNLSSESAEHHPVVEFLESGNLVLRDSRNDDPKSYLWQSFDYPTDTMLPGMKLGWNRKSGRRWFISSWKNFDDPSRGDFTYGYGSEHEDIPEFILRKGPKKYYRGGTWNGLQGSDSPGFLPNTKFTFEYIDNAEEVYFMYRLINQSVFVRVVLTQASNTEGLYRILTWVEKAKSWVIQYTIPRDRCDSYELCGPYSKCDVNNMEVCQCLKGFTPKSPEDWSRFDWSLGCKRHVPVECREGEGFNRITGVKLPETTRSWVNRSINHEECMLKCLNDCTCMAYANSDIREGGTGCILWFSDLIDMRQLSGVGQDLYIRMAASELDSEGNSRMKARMILIVSITLVGVVIMFGSGSCYILKKKRLKGATKKDDIELLLYSQRDDREIPLFDLSTITSATNNFSRENMLGEGGFGPVYKGILEGGEEIAVKRLSKDSIQGVNEFKNEVKLISKLQHKNLVRILGCCVQGVEKMLVYEYMRNNSLDAFIFDKSKSRLLDWQKRFQIILGVARGLLYLHQDSRLKIIHRDLKASNVLLDSEMVAKISDFGIARIFEGDQTEARTKKVIGTRGYMSPEYAVDGHFSVKSDVYSFGVLVLEIISGEKNRGFSHPDHDLNLLGHAWRLWTDDNSMQLVDESVNSLWFVDDISRCIHIGLLCVQNNPNCRPTMLSVLFMLSSETALPAPQPPGFYIERNAFIEENSSSRDKERCISNDATITLLEPR